MSELRKLREAIFDLATSAADAHLDDEAWYDRLWELLDPVVDVRAHRALATPSDDVEAHRFSFEGSTSQLAQHLVEAHDVLPGAVEPYAGGLSQGAWVTLDDMHGEAHARGLTAPGSHP